MSTSKTIDFMLSDSDRKAIGESSGNQVKLSTKDLSVARIHSFIPWNCKFAECSAPGVAAKKDR